MDRGSQRVVVVVGGWPSAGAADIHSRAGVAWLMGFLRVDGVRCGVFDDLLLANLEMTIAIKLHRGDSLRLTWVDSAASKGLSTSVWIDPGCVLEFEYATDRPRTTPVWIDALLDAADSPYGLHSVSGAQGPGGDAA